MSASAFAHMQVTCAQALGGYLCAVNFHIDMHVDILASAHFHSHGCVMLYKAFQQSLLCFESDLLYHPLFLDERNIKKDQSGCSSVCACIIQLVLDR